MSNAPGFLLTVGVGSPAPLLLACRISPVRDIVLVCLTRDFGNEILAGLLLEYVHTRKLQSGGINCIFVVICLELCDLLESFCCWDSF